MIVYLGVSNIMKWVMQLVKSGSIDFRCLKYLSCSSSTYVGVCVCVCVCV